MGEKEGGWSLSGVLPQLWMGTWVVVTEGKGGYVRTGAWGQIYEVGAAPASSVKRSKVSSIREMLGLRC